VSIQIDPYYFSKKKRVFDLCLAIALLIFLLPVTFVISLSVLITIGWPIIFIQKRIGQHKTVFSIFKFRTMYAGADQDQKKLHQYNESPFPAFKMSNDPRFVGVGKFLSKTGLDELPQLINILKGDMSFIGPRPLPIKEAAKLTGSWDFRYEVRPGVISYWALSDKRHKSLRHWQRLERETLTEANVIKDLKILSQTFFIPLKA